MKRFLAIGLLAALTVTAAGQSDDPAGSGLEGVVLVANSQMPDSVELARLYASQRGVPEERICLLDLPGAETISRSEYEHRLRDPLLARLRAIKMIEQVRRQPGQVAAHDSGWTTVKSHLRYLVLFYGVPLRIDDTMPWPLDKVANLVNNGIQRDGAAVDSDLSLLLQDTFDLRGRKPNPHYNQLRWENPPQGGNIVLVGRLDAPDPGLVRAMIEQALHAERYGVQGRVYIDLRAPHADDYRVGDFWFEEAGQRLLREGYDVVFERTDGVFGALYPMDNPAFYLGWYTAEVTGPFTRPEFSFRPGALAYHNHSGNARTLRSTTEAWTGPLLARGATVSLGAVYEPFLHFTPHLDIVIDRLCSGLPWADAVYLSLPALSWQTTVVGDPLYRPFAVSLEEQISRLEADKNPDADWAHVRRAMILVREGRVHAAMRYLRERLRVRESVVVREKLGDLYALNDLYDEATRQYEQVLAAAPSAEYAMRLGLRHLTMLDALGQRAARDKTRQSLRERWAGSPFLDSLPVFSP